METDMSRFKSIDFMITPHLKNLAKTLFKKKKGGGEGSDTDFFFKGRKRIYLS